MNALDDELGPIEELLRTVRPAEAEQRILELLKGLGPRELKLWEPELRRTIGQFLQKRRKKLSEELDRLMALTSPSEEHAPRALPTPKQGEIRSLLAYLQEGLSDLSARHLFQWATFYRDFLSAAFSRIELLIHAGPEVAAQVSGIFAAHAREIFSKGYAYSSRVADHAYAVTKSLSGLQKLLELPVEFYAGRIAADPSTALAMSARATASTMLAGIIRGYSQIGFGTEVGGSLLARNPKSWAHYLGFFRAEDLVAILGGVERGSFNEGLETNLLPLLKAIDEVLGRVTGGRAPVPVLSQFAFDTRRLDVSLQSPSRDNGTRIEVQVYIDRDAVTNAALREANNRGIPLILAPLRADIAEVVAGEERLWKVVVDSARLSRDELVRRVLDVLRYALSAYATSRSQQSPLTYNFAREFPLTNPFLAKYFHVYRPSVRELLRTFEQRSGVRLWCSVRRSGKTTACFDLSSSTGAATVVTQTCDNTDPSPQLSQFYDAIVAALSSPVQITNTFFVDTVARCAGIPSQATRFVFVLDEYETLFERLRLAAKRDPELRLAVVQPLLNQMVAFSRENLIVFIGQRPDAHYILMDQNQLSAYVQQDSFPLFEHQRSSATSEFTEFMRKVLTTRFEFDPAFADAIHSETAGHPFLTVNVLVEFVDWLIEGKRAMGDLHLRQKDFDAFSRAKLVPSRVSVSREYAFFRRAVAEALSVSQREDNPWLHAVYATLRELCLEYGSTLTCSRDDFARISERLGVTANVGLTPDDLLMTAAQANFLRINSNDTVSPHIRLLGRIAATTTAARG